MPAPDDFSDIARYYDRVMEHVDYERWFVLVTTLAQLLTPGFRHLDAACGTGTLIRRLRKVGWNSTGLDISSAMLAAGKKDGKLQATAVADLRALPLRGSVDYVTCLFDSVNFLVEDGDIPKTFCQVSQALADQGLFYFDIVTERMVTDHFENQEWTDNNGGFSTTWSSSYCRKTGIAETRLRVGSGATGVFCERIYPQKIIEQAVKDAGLTILGVYDAKTWKSPKRKTVRIDFIAAKNPSRAMKKNFRVARDAVIRLLM